MPKDYQEDIKSVPTLAKDWRSEFELEFSSNWRYSEPWSERDFGRIEYFIENLLTSYQLTNTHMPKDYQDVERIVEGFFTKQSDTGYSVDNAASGGDLNSKEYVREYLTPKLLELLTTYGNQRELEGVEKVEKGVPPMNSESWDKEYRDGYRKARQTTLDHIAKVKSELK
jgi:hypothetical protein